ncbi:diguanylate cyclase [Metabacillus sp. cB07]|uniref:GGDEF domain-containing response regulator n=1 Tax=Metabacillus sp. cB07 TaxID=2806989 RepID=UPI0019394F4B|nr:diguanylate cyclase [Metabacillus sp. cB07]
MKKYKQRLLKKIREQIDRWYGYQHAVEQDEVIRFLHSLAGTAPTIGMEQVGKAAAAQLLLAEKRKRDTWRLPELQNLLFPLISACYEAEMDIEEETVPNREKRISSGDELILLIDDDITLLMYLKEELELHGFTAAIFTDSDRAMKAYYDLAPDCVVIDRHMKQENGFEVVVQLKELMQKKYVPAIMISADASRETRLDSYRYGADDFILKPFDMEEFLVRIRRQIERKKQLEELIVVDELTKVYNRKFLNPAYTRLAARMKREGSFFTLAMLDLDYFKKINDTYGHLEGDEVLREFSQCLRDNLRNSDTVIRYGGEEFIILLPNAGQKEAMEVIGRIKESFSAHVFKRPDHTSYSCTFSAGLMAVPSEQAMSVEHAIECADAALYQAKENGRNAIAVYRSTVTEPVEKVMNVAVVDDDPIIRTILEDVFRKSPLLDQYCLNIGLYPDGMEFLEAHPLSKRENHFIVLDGMMPKMDGTEVLQKIRALPNQHLFTVMMLTSRKSGRDAARALQLGADDYMTKPFRLEELETRLYHLAKRMTK